MAFDNFRVGALLEDVRRGQQRVVSHAQVSQYQTRHDPNDDQRPISNSACGLAALNCARLLFQLTAKHDDCQSPDAGGQYEMSMVSRLVAEETSIEITKICAMWTRNEHIDIEDLLQTPLFQNAAVLVQRDYGPAEQARFIQTLEALDSIDNEDGKPIAVIITRPPEIILCIKLATICDDIYIIYDSHPRPAHPEGAAFTFFNSIESTAAHLTALLAIDKNLLADTSLRWQADLLSHFSAHVLMPNPLFGDPLTEEQNMVDATVAILALRQEVAQLRQQQHELEKQLRDFKGKQPCRPGGYSSITPQSLLSSSKPNGNSYSDSDSDSDSIDHKLAAELQLAYNAENTSLETTRNDLLQRQPATFDCGICFETYVRDSVFSCRPCDHSFCRPCIKTYATTRLKDRRYPISCPTCQASTKGTQIASIEQDTLDLLGLDDKVMHVYYELQLTAHSILLHCRKCNKSMFVDREEHNASKLIVCPLPKCQHIWCKSCQQDIDVQAGGPQHSCDGSNELQHLMKTKGWKHCPGCQTPIQRESGCNHMSCMSPACNTHFCYTCGELIIQSVMRQEIQRAVSNHYSRRCALFNYT